MTVMVALLRGVNVGGAAVVAMADVRRVAEACGYQHVRTYVQSGNVVFSTRSGNADAVAERLRAALAAATAVRPAVIVRTRDELHAVVDNNPFAGRHPQPTQLHVVFMPGREPAVLPPLDLAPFAPEQVHAAGRELYLYLPGGVGRSRLAIALARQKGPAGTMRNWRTVTKLVELADSTPGQP